MSTLNSRFTVELLRSGQQRAYGDTIHEYKIHCEHFRTWGREDEQGWEPFLMGGNTDAAEAKAQVEIAAGRLKRSGNEDIQWALGISRGLCGPFVVKGEPEYGGLGRSSLQWIKLSASEGTIHFLLMEPWND